MSVVEIFEKVSDLIWVLTCLDRLHPSARVDDVRNMLEDVTREALTSGKRRAEAQVVYHELLRRADAQTQPTLADVHNHLAVSLLESESYRIDGQTAAFDVLEGRESELCRGHDTSGVVLLGLTTPCDAISDALAASRAALRLRPACRYAHAQNYYQVLATSECL